MLNNYGQGVRDRDIKSVKSFQHNDNSSPKNQHNDDKGGSVAVQTQASESRFKALETSTIINLPNPDAIVYPDKIAHDSYGNIVTPYTTLVDDPALNAVTPSVNQLKHISGGSASSGIGHMTDVNRDGGFSDNNSGKIATKLGFIVPSYASGVTKVDTYKSGIVKPELNLQPPLSSGNYNYPQLNENTKAVPESVGTSSSIFGGANPAAPASSLIAPAPAKNLNAYGNSFSSGSTSQISDEKYSTLPGQQSIPISSGGSTNQLTKNSSNVPNSSSDFGKYTGGFGGATNQPALRPQPFQSLIGDSGKYTGGFGGSTVQSSLTQQTASISSSDSGKYTGGNGGAANQAVGKGDHGDSFVVPPLGGSLSPLSPLPSPRGGERVI